ncbi:hypothetical protein [Planosporangium mesophilum]|uniref:Uncharacterized protein n=1 Tax=Planosporangium mesophilum TaxID=689768 RepID=A0A8J3TR42_9ACTN|nr:hypothetical protein [Planosporangium mesophilum]NJC86638.1 hypothetical protein [Planosporangium mesophilum]GII25800.1 hypothetical protein Pme01_53970 [Planosporangium mesophilum]
MSTAEEPDAIFVGGPRDGTPFHSDEAALVELEIGGMIHRYIRTTAHRGSHLVYNYDGEVDPTGAQSGAETR